LFHVSRLEMNVIWTDFSDVCRVLNSRWQWRILVCWSVSRLWLLIRNRRMSRLPDPDSSGCPGMC